MTHHITHPENWAKLDDLHNYLWKKMPMDRFEFIESPGDRAPVYAGTSLPADPAFIVFKGDQPTVAFFDHVSEAIQDFQNETIVALPTGARPRVAERKMA